MEAKIDPTWDPTSTKIVWKIEVGIWRAKRAPESHPGSVLVEVVGPGEVKNFVARVEIGFEIGLNSTEV